MTNDSGEASVQFKVPYGTKGVHTIRAVQPQQRRAATTTYEVVPRIKLLPNIGAAGDTINVSLRGYAKKETVRIRWQHGTKWTTLATVLTSNTGSANVDVQVPDWSAEMAKVRGDSTNTASGGRAQTMFTRTDGGPQQTTTVIMTVTPTATETIAAASPPSETATIEPTDTATQPATSTPTIAVPATDTPAPTLTNTPSATSTESATATATASDSEP
jgi:hypothetical protein